MVMSEQTCPLQKMSLPPRAGRKDCYFENKSLDSETHYLESCTNTGRSITFQFFAMPPGTKKHGLRPIEHEPFFKLRQKNQEVMSTWKFFATDEWCIWCMICINADAKMTFFRYQRVLDKLKTFANIFSKMTRLESCQDKLFWNAKRKEVGSTSSNL